jgi:ketosteroid isomerase-like protein
VSSPELADARALFDRRVAAWLRGDLDAYLACWHDDMEIVLPGRDEPLVGLDRYRALVERSLAWARPVAFDVHHLAVDGDVVLAEWTMRAERRDDGVLVQWSGASACGVRDGRIAWWREYHRAPPAPVTRPG